MSQSSTTDRSINHAAGADVPFEDDESQIISDDDEGFVIEYRGVHGESEQDYSSAGNTWEETSIGMLQPKILCQFHNIPVDY